MDSKEKRILVSVLSAVVLVFLCIGGFMTYRYVTGNIDGNGTVVLGVESIAQDV